MSRKMKPVTIFFNAEEMEQLKKKAAAKKMSVYTFCKKRILNPHTPAAVYALMLYAAGATAFIVYLLIPTLLM